MTKFRVQRFLIKALPTAQTSSGVNDRDSAGYKHLEGLVTFARKRKQETTLTEDMVR